VAKGGAGVGVAVRERARAGAEPPRPPPPLTRFHRRVAAEAIAARGPSGPSRLAPALAQAAIDLNPHQVEAAAFALSSLFLIGYLVHHARVGSVPFAGTGPVRTSVGNSMWRVWLGSSAYDTGP